jgi:hypothetical protein
MSNKVISLIAVVALFVGIAGIFTPVGKTVVEKLGANAGPDHYNYEQFFGGMLRGSTHATTTGAAAITAQEFWVGYDTVRVTPIVGDTTLTFMASSSARNLVPKLGSMQETCVVNATTTAGIDLTFAAGTGIDLKTASSSPTDLTIGPNGMACFRFVRGVGTTATQDIVAAIVEFNIAD